MSRVLTLLAIGGLALSTSGCDDAGASVIYEECAPEPCCVEWSKCGVCLTEDETACDTDSGEPEYLLSPCYQWDDLQAECLKREVWVEHVSVCHDWIWPDGWACKTRRFENICGTEDPKDDDGQFQAASPTAAAYEDAFAPLCVNFQDHPDPIIACRNRISWAVNGARPTL